MALTCALANSSISSRAVNSRRATVSVPGQWYDRDQFLQLNGADDRKDSKGPILGQEVSTPVVAQR